MAVKEVLALVAILVLKKDIAVEKMEMVVMETVQYLL